MSIFSKLGLTVEAPAEVKPAATLTQQSDISNTNSNTNSNFVAPATIATPVSGQAPGTVEPKLLAHFEQVFTNANIPGPDFFEYSQTLNSMRNIIKEDAVLYPAAFAAFKAQPGAQAKSVDDLVSTIGHYVDAINNDGTFQAQVDAKKNSVIAGLNQQKDEINKNVISWQQQLTDLTTKIAESNGKLTGISQQIVTEETKLNTSIANFNVTKQTVIDTLKAHAERMKQYLK